MEQMGEKPKVRKPRAKKAQAVTVEAIKGFNLDMTCRGFSRAAVAAVAGRAASAAVAGRAVVAAVAGRAAVAAVAGRAASAAVAGRAMCEGDGQALYCTEFADNGSIASVACGITGRDGIVAGTWYVCKNGKLVEAA